MSAYRIPSPYDRPPLQRRASGLALALGVNLLLLLVLLGIGAFKPEPPLKPSTALVIDMLPESHSRANPSPAHAATHRTSAKPVPKPPPIILPVKPTIAVSAPKLVEMNKDELAAADISNLPSAGRSGGDSEAVGHGPHGEVLYAADWARRPTSAETGGYLPKNAPDGWGMIACKTIPENRVDDCVELGNDPPGSHLASAVRQAAWQFRVRPPRKNGVPLVGAWVRIAICYNVSGCEE